MNKLEKYIIFSILLFFQINKFNNFKKRIMLREDIENIIFNRGRLNILHKTIINYIKLLLREQHSWNIIFIFMMNINSIAIA